MEHNISKHDFTIINKYINSVAGISIDYCKEFLFVNKLKPLIKKYNFATFNDFAKNINKIDSPHFQQEIISAITNHETFFFRDTYPFETLKKVILPKIFQKKDKINILSGGCSYGQESYSLAMILEELKTLEPIKYKNKEYRIIAEDIDKDVLKYAKKGVYSKYEIDRGIIPDRLEKFFIPIGDSKYGIKNHLKDNINFLYNNYLNIEESVHSNFDLILLRNVLFYFSEGLQIKIINRIYNLLVPGGYFLIGVAESLYGLEHNFSIKTIGKTFLYHKE